MKRTPVFSFNHQWNKSFKLTPLSLGLIQSYALYNDHENLSHDLQFFPVLSYSKEKLISVAQNFSPAIWLFPNYVWTIKENLNLSHLIKEIEPRNITIHGGPSTPKYEKYLHEE